MALSRKHYNAIAAIFKENMEGIEQIRNLPVAISHRHRRDLETREATLCSVAESLAYYFKSDNPNFDFNRFSKAVGCGGD